MIRLGIIGAAGRMGKEVAAAAIEDKDVEIVATLEDAKHNQIGTPYNKITGLNLSDELILESSLTKKIDIAIDFSAPQATEKWLEICKDNNIPMVIGTTGLKEQQIKKLKSASDKIPILYAPNMSVGMNLLFILVGKIAKILGDDYDIEIVEHHHRFKKDAPSGSALKLAHSILEAKGLKESEDTVIFGRHATDSERKAGQIGIHAIRMGDIVGYHEVNYSTIGETITISHRATTRQTFARGAIRAAKWLVKKRPGLYSMNNLLFDNTEI